MAIAALAAAGENIVAASTLSEETYLQFKYRLRSLGIVVKFVDVDNFSSVRDAVTRKQGQYTLRASVVLGLTSQTFLSWRTSPMQQASLW